MNFLLVSSEADKKYLSGLADFGTVVPLPPLTSLPKPIASHADTLIASVSDEFFVYKDYKESDKLFRALGLPCTVISAAAGNVYPFDATLNCFTVGDRLVCREKSVAPEILAFAKKRGYKTLNVRQGYAHCSCVPVGDGILTSDRGIFHAAEKAGIDAAFVRPAGISLPGYSGGFIGGTCGTVGRIVVFFGDLRRIPDGEKAEDFIKSKGFDPYYLSDKPPVDYGGIISIEV
jgi:hypothetical protein